MSQQRAVQLSAAALALVLCRDGEGGKCDSPAPSGQDLFADFKAQNLRSFWNKRLVKAVAEVCFQGWMENCVLLVHGNANHLEVLRETWMRRALRSPKGFTIRAVGDVSPMQMSPITQSQFIPLSEVLCSVISDMNTAHIVVNQEALISHMTKAHPGMTIPTQDILYNALGALIKERKIYHTGEGYFIVTPQTYFITNSLMKDEQRWITAENDPPSPPPITYLVSTESCVETTTEAAPTVAHCKSCRCFTQQPAQSVQDQQSVSEYTGKSLKWPKETKPSVQHQSTSTAADYQPSEMSKSTTSRKDKEKASRKFGLSLFRRNTAKKEKPKKEYATYSGQFPPEEWPVRDEDDLNNLPRDLEHAIIKRINPELTVDNLVRHTVMMKKLEEHGINKGISTEILASKHRLHSKGNGRRSASKTARQKKKGHSSREKQRVRNKASMCLAELEGAQEAAVTEKVPSRLRPEIAVDELEDQAREDFVNVDSKNLYKKRIDNPFQGKGAKDAALGTGLRAQKKREAKEHRAERKERAAHWSKSWDSSRTKATGSEAIQAIDDRPCKSIKGKKSSTLRIEDKWKHVKEGKSRSGSVYDDCETDTRYAFLQDGQAEAAAEQLGCALPPQVTYHCDTAAVLPSWSRPNNQHQLSLSLRQLSSTGDRTQKPDHLPSHPQINSTKSELLPKDNGLPPDLGQMDSEGFTDDDQAFYQQAVEDDDACSSLYLNEDSDLDSREASQSGTVHYQQPFSREDLWSSTVDDSRWHESGTQQTSNTHITQTENGCRQRSPFLYEHREEANHTVEPQEAVDCSIFDYCHTSEADSDTETLHKSADEGEGQSSHWNHEQHAEESLRKQFEQKLELRSTPHNTVSSQNAPGGPIPGEKVENHSITGDSGIDSPRTRVSLASNNSVILEGLKRRSFLQNLEKLHSKSNAIRPQSSLLQLTPVMNV
ncbi:STOX1 protein, partial [Amia calva]|nr:STOX1 protein [Amia calva]